MGSVHFECMLPVDRWTQFQQLKFQSISDVLQSLRAEAIQKLRKIQARRRHMGGWRIDHSFGRVRRLVEWPGHWGALADAADHPVDGAGWILNHKVGRLAVPGHAPTHRPSVSRTHFPAIAKVETAVRCAAVVVKYTGGPSLVRFGAA